VSIDVVLFITSLVLHLFKYLKSHVIDFL